MYCLLTLLHLNMTTFDRINCDIPRITNATNESALTYQANFYSIITLINCRKSNFAKSNEQSTLKRNHAYFHINYWLLMCENCYHFGCKFKYRCLRRLFHLTPQKRNDHTSIERKLMVFQLKKYFIRRKKKLV